MAKVTMPQLGESVAEGTIGKWLKQPGDHVDKYEPLLEVITDKVNAEVPSPFEGILKEILAEEGATVPNNAEIAVIETADDGASSDGSEPAEAKAEPAAEQDAAEGRGEARRRRPCPGRLEGAGRFGRIRERLVRRGSRIGRLQRGTDCTRACGRPPSRRCGHGCPTDGPGRCRCPDDPRRSAAAPRARLERRADRRHRRRRAHHP